MKKLSRLNILFLLTSLFCLMGCRKNEEEPLIIDPVVVPDLVKIVRWANTGEETYTYNNDSTLRTTIAASIGTMTLTREFNYGDKRLVRVLKSDLMEENFQYDNLGAIVSITETMRNQSYPGIRLEFEYNSDNTVKQMKYYEFNDLRSDLKSTTFYEYDTQMSPVKIITTSAVNPAFKGVYEFDGFSDICYFNPWTLIEPWHLVSEGFQIYNYPFLSSQHRLPLKITKKLELNNEVQETETKTFTYSIKNNRLEWIQHVGTNFKLSYEY